MENFKISGYSYIDEELTNISKKLPKEDKEKFIKTCTSLYSAGVSEGVSKIKNTNIIK